MYWKSVLSQEMFLMHVSLFEGTLVKNVTNQIVFICNKGLFLSSRMHNILFFANTSWWLKLLGKTRVSIRFSLFSLLLDNNLKLAIYIMCLVITDQYLCQHCITHRHIYWVSMKSSFLGWINFWLGAKRLRANRFGG